MSTIDRSRSVATPVTTGTRPTVQPAAAPVAQPTPAAAPRNTVKDGFDAKSTATRATTGVFTAPAGSKDKVYDGKLVGAGGQTFEPGTPLSQIPAYTPANNPNAKETLIYVNGIATDKAGQERELQGLADNTGMRTIGIHNATQGMVSDLLQCVKDKLGKGTNPAVDTLADTVYNELKAGRDVHLVGYSHGGLITARALGDVAKRLRIEDGMSAADVEKTMSKLSVETFGGAGANFPDGPKYVHYVNDKDIVPTLFGVGGSGKSPLDLFRHAGKDAKINYFSEKSMTSGAHSLLDTYLKHRVPFESGRAGQF